MSRSWGRVELSRLELGGLAPVVEGKRASVLRIVEEAFAPAPVPQRPQVEAEQVPMDAMFRRSKAEGQIAER